MAQIKKKFLASNAVDGSKVQFMNNESFRVKSASGVDVELFKLDGSNLFQFLQTPRVGSDPSHGNEVSRKSYVDAQILAEAAARVQADSAEQAAREAAISSEAAARESADNALDARLDIVEGSDSTVGSIAKALKDAKDYTDLETSARETAVSNEQSARESADTNLQEQIDALDMGNAAALAQEVSDRQAADTTLQNNIDVEKGRIDAILLASDADKDSFAEIVQLINSVDTTNDNAFASYVLSNDAALAQEVSDRQSGDSALDARLDILEGADNVAGSVAKALKDAKAYTDAEQSRAEGAESALDGRLDVIEGDNTTVGSIAKAEKDAKDYADSIVSSEQSRAEGVEAGLQSDLDQEILDRQSAITGEENARMTADTAIQSELDATQTGAGLGTDGGYTAPTGTQYLGSATSLKDADSKLDVAIYNEVNARTTAISNVEQSISDLDAAMTQGFDDAQAYTDQKVSDLVNGAPALLDTLKELADAIGDDENFATNIMTSISNETSARQAADTAEANARSSADTALQSALDQEILDRETAVSAEQSAREAADSAESAARTAELPRHAKVRYTLTSTDIDNGYVDLDHVVLANSTHVFIDRLACHEQDDYTMSTVSGKTRVTFTESFMTSEEGPGVGDLFRCGYAYKNGDQP